jgi:hypothetical protein
MHTNTLGVLFSVVDKALCCQPKGRRFYIRGFEYMFSLHNPSFCTRLWGLLNL